MEIFVEVGLLLVLATFSAILMRVLKQPLIVGYILAGIAAGPYFLNILHSTEHIELFSKLGITILLFIVGLNLSPKVIKEVGKVSLVGGIGQIIFTTMIGFSIAVFLGIDKLAAMYLAIALTFSSTIIVLKLLSDRGDLNKLYGKIAVGFLIVQDIVATLILLFVSAFAESTGADVVSMAGIIFAKGVFLLAALYVISIYIIPRFSKFLASSQEILFLFSISWGVALAGLFYALGLSMEIGALVAGVALSLTPFSYEIEARLKPLRDFFIVLFFLLLGSQLVLDNVSAIFIPSLILSLFVLIGNPFIVIVLMSVMGHKNKTGFMTGLTVAQISEFSLILAALGFRVGHVSQEVLSIVTLVGLITIAGSTYFILYADNLYRKVEKLLKFLELEKNTASLGADSEKYDMLLFGYDRVGRDYVSAFEKLAKPYMVIDFNPESITRLRSEKIPYKFGDAEDAEFLQELHLGDVKMVVSTLPDLRSNILLTKSIRLVNQKAVVIALSHNLEQAEELYAAGATYVVMPHYIGATYTIDMILKNELDLQGFEKERKKHMLYIKQEKAINL